MNVRQEAAGKKLPVSARGGAVPSREQEAAGRKLTFSGRGPAGNAADNAAFHQHLYNLMATKRDGQVRLCCGSCHAYAVVPVAAVGVTLMLL